MDKLRFLSLFLTSFNKFNKNEHSCKIFYVNNKVFYPFWAPEKDQNRFLGYKVSEGILELYQGTKLFQYCTCPAGRVTYKSHLSCKHIHRPLKEYAIFFFQKHKGVICNMTSLSISSHSTRPTGPELWVELLVLSRFLL